MQKCKKLYQKIKQKYDKFNDKELAEKSKDIVLNTQFQKNKCSQGFLELPSLRPDSSY